MSNSEKCPTCGNDKPVGSPCPVCLLGVGLESMSDDQPGGSSAWTPPGIDELTTRFPELDVIELLGRGGMGAVYKARQPALDRLVAIKILPPEIGGKASFAERFAREAKALAKLNHPNIVTVHDFGERDGLYFFMMEFVDGVNLRQLLDTGRVSAREALAIVPQICDALQCAHDQGIVHRDIKPENILMDRQGRVKIADFGLAKLMSESDRHSAVENGEQKAGDQIHTLAAVGTPSYMAPEQVNTPGEVDHRADIYALGVVFYQMLTGMLPDQDLTPPSRREVMIDVRLDEIVLQALEKNPARRYSQVSMIKTRLDNMTGAEAQKAPPKPPAIESGNKKSKPWIWMTVFLVLHLLATGVLFVSACFILPKFTNMFADLGARLPALTILTINVGHLLQRMGILLLPLFLLFDAGICALLSLGRLRKSLIVWGIAMLLIIGGATGFGVFSVFLPLRATIQDMSDPRQPIEETSSHQAPPVAGQVTHAETVPPEEFSEGGGSQKTPLTVQEQQAKEARARMRDAEQRQRVMMARERHRVMQRKKALVLGIGVALIVLLAVPLTIGAIIWIILGVKKACALGRAALFLATGLPFFDLMAITTPLLLYFLKPVAVVAQSPQASGNSPLDILLVIGGFFTALELGAFIMGCFARKTTSGKAAMVISGIWLAIALLLLLVMAKP